MIEIERFFDWLSSRALPFWADVGVDRESGGFIERVSPEGEIEADQRRARLVARQIYAFSTASRLGWSGPGREIADHGYAALVRHHIGEGNSVIPVYHPETGTYSGGFDLYDQAFVLFGLSYAARISSDRCEQRALDILRRMREGWQHPGGGFGETAPPTAPLKANPHMHLFEAAQAWLEVSDDQAWSFLASEIANLCLGFFINPGSGALHEYFDASWKIEADPAVDVIEPGHQSEWAWLLLRWFQRTGEQRFADTALRLFSVAEDHGTHLTDQRLINELDASLALRDPLMRLWPQTERIKALIAVRGVSPVSERASYDDRISRAVGHLLDYFNHPIQGSWWEHLSAGSMPVKESARASSLYHIMGAASELSTAYGVRLR